MNIVGNGALKRFKQDQEDDTGGNVSKANIGEDGQYLYSSRAKR